MPSELGRHHRLLIGIWECFAHRYRLDSDITRQTNPDYLAIIFPGQFQHPMVVIAVRVFPIDFWGYISKTNAHNL